MPANGFRGAVAVKSRGARIPALDAAFQTHPNDAVIREVHKGGEAGPGFLLALALGNTRGHNQSRGVPGKLQGVDSDLDVDYPAILQPVLPLTRLGQDGRLLLNVLGHWIDGVDVRNAHVQELVARVAILGDRGVVDLQEGQGLPVIDPHRLRIGGE